jgi:hypothetical protein
VRAAVPASLHITKSAGKNRRLVREQATIERLGRESVRQFAPVIEAAVTGAQLNAAGGEAVLISATLLVVKFNHRIPRLPDPRRFQESCHIDL